MSQPPKRQIKTAVKVFGVLDILHERGRASLQEIADEIGLTKSTTHSYLQTLLHLEVLVKENEQYRLGFKFLEYGGRERIRRELYLAAKPELDDLHRETGHTAQLAVEEHEDLVVLARVNPNLSVGGDSQVGPHGHLQTPPIGHRIHFHTPALGKVLLAHFPESKVDAIVDKHGLPAMSERAITDRAELEAELETIREQGYAVHDEDETENYKGLARPLLVEGDLRGSVSIAGPKTEITLNEETILELLQSAADRIQLKLRSGSQTGTDLP